MTDELDEMDAGAMDDPFDTTSFELDELDDIWDDVEAAATGGPPDGTYQVKVESVKLDRTRTAGDPILKMAFVVLHGKYAGKKIFKNNTIKTKDNLKYLKADLNAMGVELTKVSDLKKEEVLESMLDIVLEVKQATRTSNGNEYTNVYINKKLDTSAGDAVFEKMNEEANKVF